jgi:hypothetical protein
MEAVLRGKMAARKADYREMRKQGMVLFVLFVMAAFAVALSVVGM